MPAAQGTLFGFRSTLPVYLDTAAEICSRMSVENHVAIRQQKIMSACNRVVQGCGKYLGEVTIGTTILDRLMHRPAMLQFAGSC